MRMTSIGLAVIGCLLMAVPAVAGNIGFVDAERAVATVKEGQAKIKELEAWADPQRARVEALANRVNELRERINQQRTVASPDALQDLQNQEIQARRTYEDGRRAFERDLEAKQNEFLADVAVKVGTVASDYGEANGFDAIFVLNAQPLIYVRKTTDLTDTIIKLYDQRFPYRGD
jgi:Skp family chaperone for outer membrane proteins